MRLFRWFGASILMSGLLLVGCSQPASPPKGKTSGKEVAKVEEKDDHDHGDGPHGGVIIEFGKYHAEFTVDHPKKEATIYLLSGNLKKNVPISSDKLTLSIKSPQFQTELKPVPQEGDPKGESSRYVGTHESLGKVQPFEGTLSGEIDGKPYLGDFKEVEDEHDKKEKK
jgi:hypothetical protein